MRQIDTTVCVVGGGPAGLMLGLLLARQGVAVTVLEKHPDFLRDFRGDTVHPSTLDVLDEIGLGPAVDALPTGRRVRSMSVSFDDGTYPVIDFSRLKGSHRYVLFMPQWDFLELLAEKASGLPAFTLMRSTEVRAVDRDPDGRVSGVIATTADGEVRVRTRLTVACDGRFSVVRKELGLTPRDYGAPMDVLWFRLPRRDDDPEGLDMRVAPGGLLLCIDRNDYYQCAYVIAKGGFAAVQAEGIEAFRASILRRAAHFADRVSAVSSWDDVKLLTVRVDRLARWHVPGALLIGDAAHAMSPIGGVGINLAIQDAVATARILGPRLAAGTFTDADLPSIARRRMFPTRVTQAVQVAMQQRIVDPLLHATGTVNAPGVLRVVGRTPVLRGLPARVVAYGVRPEHVRSGS